MIISFVNRTPASGKTSACIALANYLNDMPENRDKRIIIFDCDPKLTSYTKFENYVKKAYSCPPGSYQVISLPLDDDGLVFKVLNDIKGKEDFFLFDLPSKKDEWLDMRILVSSHLIIVPFQPSKKHTQEFKSYLSYLHNLKSSLSRTNFVMISKIILVPVEIKDIDHEEITLENDSEYLLSPPIERNDNISEILNPISIDNFKELPFKGYSDFIIDLIRNNNSELQESQTKDGIPSLESDKINRNSKLRSEKIIEYDLTQINEAENF